MAKPNRFDVAEKVGEQSPATEATVAEALGAAVDSEQLQKAFDGAAQHGLIERESGGADGEGAGWTLSEKGRRRLEEKAGDR